MDKKTRQIDELKLRIAKLEHENMCLILASAKREDLSRVTLIIQESLLLAISADMRRISRFIEMAKIFFLRK